MRQTPNVASSLVLSGLNAAFCTIALLLVYSGVSPWWGAVLIWTTSPPLLLLAVAYFVRDLLHPQMRKQALLAVALLVPVAIVEWASRFTGI